MNKNRVKKSDKIDDLTFQTMFGILQSGMWLLTDLEIFLNPIHMSQGRLAILLALSHSEDGVLCPMNIARITGKSRPTVTKMLDRLEKDGYIRSCSHKEDGRSKQLDLTQKGYSVLDEIVPGYNERLLQMSAKLTDKDKKDLLRILSKLDFLDSEKCIVPLP